MKKNFILLILFCLLGSRLCAQELYKGVPVIKASSNLADYRFGNELIKGNWIISPNIAYDSLFIRCYSESEDAGFYTDLDSISFNLQPGKSRNFYVLLGDTAYAYTVIKAIAPDYSILRFDTAGTNSELKFWYEQNGDNEYLNTLRSKYPVDSLILNASSDTERVLRILHWVHIQWKHDGTQSPKKNDALSILEEVKAGGRFPCFAYAIVTSACLNSVGLKSRVLYLKAKDVETTTVSPGHVVNEVYLNDLKKWAYIDPQFDVMPFLGGSPVNGIEFQNAINNGFRKLEIRSLSGTSKIAYLDFVYPYLYYFNFSFDNRIGISFTRNSINGKSHLMLVPLGAPNPTKITMYNLKIDYCIYTNSIKDFYSEPAQ